MNYKLIDNPNLPDGKVVHCLVGAVYNDVIAELKNLGITPISVGGSEKLEEEIRFHADINACCLSNGRLLLNDDIAGEFNNNLLNLRVETVRNINSPYPYDVRLNALFLGERIICNPKTVSSEILLFANENDYEIIPTKQGYSRCAICVVNKNAIITEDSGLTSLLKNYQIDVLSVSQGNVFLSKSHCGFLGGASGKVDKDKIYFNGNLEKHKNYNEIKSFLYNYNVEPVFNSARPLADFGGLIPLTESLD